MRRRGFSKSETGKIIETVLSEEGRPPESVFDFVQTRTRHVSLLVGEILDFGGSNDQPVVEIDRDCSSGLA